LVPAGFLLALLVKPDPIFLNFAIGVTPSGLISSLAFFLTGQTCGVFSFAAKSRSARIRFRLGRGLCDGLPALAVATPAADSGGQGCQLVTDSVLVIHRKSLRRIGFLSEAGFHFRFPLKGGKNGIWNLSFAWILFSVLRGV
jgi:hypothetical protein